MPIVIWWNEHNQQLSEQNEIQSVPVEYLLHTSVLTGDLKEIGLICLHYYSSVVSSLGHIVYIAIASASDLLSSSTC